MTKLTSLQNLKHGLVLRAEIESENLLETKVEISIPDITVMWEDKEKLMKELREVLVKYMVTPPVKVFSNKED